MLVCGGENYDAFTGCFLGPNKSEQVCVADGGWVRCSLTKRGKKIKKQPLVL